MNLESKARINSLISAANATTGKADTDLTSAVGALIAGFGQGGGSGGGGASGIYMAEITPATDTQIVSIEHNLDAEVKIAVLWADDFTVDPSEVGQNIPVFGVFVATNIDVMVTSSSTIKAFAASATYAYASGQTNRVAGYSSAAYIPRILDRNTFEFHSANTAAARYKAGQTLRVFILAEV